MFFNFFKKKKENIKEEQFVIIKYNVTIELENAEYNTSTHSKNQVDINMLDLHKQLQDSSTNFIIFVLDGTSEKIIIKKELFKYCYVSSKHILVTKEEYDRINKINKSESINQ
jgi:hypothetical protein